MAHLLPSREPTPGRRHSLLEVSGAAKWRPRSASTGTLNWNGYSPSLSMSRGIATPCFVSPTMGFTTQFNYDSPIQVLTSRSNGMLNPGKVSYFRGHCSLKRLPHHCKVLLIALLLTFAASLFIIRKWNESNPLVNLPACDENDLNCLRNVEHSHPSLMRFMGVISPTTPHYHSIEAEDSERLEEIHNQFPSGRREDMEGEYGEQVEGNQEVPAAQQQKVQVFVDVLHDPTARSDEMNLLDGNPKVEENLQYKHSSGFAGKAPVIHNKLELSAESQSDSDFEETFNPVDSDSLDLDDTEVQNLHRVPKRHSPSFSEKPSTWKRGPVIIKARMQEREPRLLEEKVNNRGRHEGPASEVSRKDRPRPSYRGERLPPGVNPHRYYNFDL